MFDNSTIASKWKISFNCSL